MPFKTVCKTCGKIRYVGSRKRAAKTRNCQRCHLKQIAPLGARATIEKYGLSYLTSLVRAYRLENPTSLETLVEDALTGMSDEISIEWEREYQWTGESGTHWLADFLIYYDDREIVLEVNGHYWHSQADRIQKDKLKQTDGELRFDDYVILDETIIAETDDLIQQILSYLIPEEADTS